MRATLALALALPAGGCTLREMAQHNSADMSWCFGFCALMSARNRLNVPASPAPDAAGLPVETREPGAR